MNKTMKVLFFLRKPSANYVGGAMPIYMRLTVDGQRIEMSVQREWDPVKWDRKAGRALGLKKEASKQLNNYLDVLQGKVYEAQRELVSNGLEVSAEKIRDFLMGKEESKKTLLEVYRYHVHQVKELVGKEYALGRSSRFIGSFFET